MPDKHNQKTPPLRFNRNEIGGALGDLGTFIPLVVGMVNRCGLQLVPTLVGTGLMNIISGLLFRIPMPVQPMKAIAAVAIAEGLSEGQILSAGMITAAAILILGVTGLINALARAIPKSVIRGLQLALGMKLLTNGFALIAKTQPFGWDSISMGICCTALVLTFYFSKRVPGALLVFGIGLLALMASNRNLITETQFGFSWSWPQLGAIETWKSGLMHGAIPQIPLTMLNSVIAVCALSLDLYPNRPASPIRVANSVALMNIVCCPFGAMPMCHGAGGLAAQHRFGARTGGSVIILGCAKIVLALTIGGSLLLWLQAFPKSVLGVLLLFSGLELAMVCRDQNTRIDFFVMIITAGACLAVNTALGFVVGWIMAALLIWGVFRIDPTSVNE